MQRRGLHGMGLAELLAEAGAPKGVLYHHFPGGKTELAVVSIEATTAQIAQSLDRLIAERASLVPMLRAWFAAAQSQLERSGFERGCPLATVTLESTVDDTALRAALARSFETIRDKLALMLRASGFAPPRAQRLAALIVATYEGGLIQARVGGASSSMVELVESLIELLPAAAAVPTAKATATAAAAAAKA